MLTVLATAAPAQPPCFTPPPNNCQAVALAPCCNTSTFENIVATPDCSCPTTFTIRNGNGSPMAGALVEIYYSPACDAAACWCPGQPHPVISGTTNAAGQWTFCVAGGGCLDPSIHSPCIDVCVNGLLMTCITLGQVSPDLVSTTSPPCVVGLADVVAFTVPLSTSTYGFCYDLDSDGVVGLSDAIKLTGPASSGAHCP
jgi:hypothetical protein